MDSSSDKQLVMIRMMLCLPFVILALHAEVRVPQLGSIRCADGSVRPVYGVPAAFVLGKPVLLSAVSSSFSAVGGIVATGDAIQLLNPAGISLAAFPAPDPGALVNIGRSLSSAIAWLPSTSSLVYWEGKSFRQIVLPAPPSGQVTSVRRSGSAALLLVLEENAVSENAISLSSGYIVSVSFLGDAQAPAVRLGDFLLFPGPEGLEIEGPQGRRSVAIPASNLSLEQMTTDWIHISTPGSTQHWALYLTNRTLQLFQLPAALPQGSIR